MGKTNTPIATPAGKSPVWVEDNEFSKQPATVSALPEPRQVVVKNVLLGVGPFLIIMELFERLGYYSITGNMVPLLRQPAYDVEPAKISALKSCFTSFLYACCLFGGYLADVRLGRYRTILYFCILYSVGMLIAAVATLPQITSTSLFFIGLFAFVSMGSGAIKPNMVVLGGDQFEEKDEVQCRQKVTFFNYYYWAIQLGATMAFGPLAILGESAEFGYTLVFFIGAGCMLMALGLFFAGRKRYIKYPPQGSVLADFVKILTASASYSAYGMAVCCSTALVALFFILALVAIFLKPTPQFIVSSVAAGGVLLLVAIFMIVGQSTSWLDKLKSAGKFSQRSVTDAAQFVRLFPYVGALIIWQAIYDQMNTQFFNQTFQFDLRLGGGSREVTTIAYKNGNYYDTSAEVPAQLLNLANCFVILVFIPFLDMVVYPAVTKIRGQAPTPLQRFGVGMFMAVLAMTYSGVIEIFRRNAGPLVVADGLPGAGSPVYGRQNGIMNDFSYWWAIPQYIIIGLAEAFINTTAMDFFYGEAPDSLKSLSQASQLFCVTPGSTFSSALASIFKSFTPADLNEGHQEYLYFFLAALGLLNLVLFLLFSKNYVYKCFREQEEVEEGGKGDFPVVRLSLASAASGELVQRTSFIQTK